MLTSAGAQPVATDWETSSTTTPFVCPILYTHEVDSGAALGQTISALQAAGFQPTTLHSVEDALAGRGPVPDGCLVLTFDDALMSQYLNAVPALQSLNVPAVFFFMPAFSDGVHTYMTTPQLAEVAADGFEVGAHTCNHADLPSLEKVNLGAMTAEIVDCKHLLEDEIGKTVNYFAYPNGTFDHVVWTTVAGAGYAVAVSTEQTKTLKPSDRWYLPRITYTPGETTEVLNRIQNAP